MSVLSVWAWGLECCNQYLEIIGIILMKNFNRFLNERIASPQLNFVNNARSWVHKTQPDTKLIESRL